MKKVIVFFVVLLFGIKLQAQFKDSVLKIINTAGLHDTAKLKQLAVLFNQNLYKNLGNTEMAVHCYDSIAAKFTSTVYNGRAYTMKGILNYYKGNADSAIANHLQAIKVFDKIGDLSSKAKAINNLASSYQLRNKPLETIEYLKQSLEIFIQLNDKRWQALVSQNIGIEYKKLSQYDTSDKYLNASFAYFNTSGDERFAALALNELGTNLLKRKQYDAALEKCRQALTRIQPLNDLVTKATILSNLGNALYHSNKIKEAETVLAEALSINRQYHSLEYEKESLQLLIQVYEQQKKFDKAFVLQKDLMSVSDSLYNKEKDSKIVEAVKKYELDIKEEQLRVQQLTIKDQKQKLVMYFGGLISLIILVGVVLFFLRQKQKLALLLQEKNVIVNTSLHEKETLLKEIHHRVKNNLQVVSSLLSLQSKNVSDENALRALNEGRDRVKSMALIHQNLYRDDDLMGVDVKDYIEKLITSLFTSYNIQPNSIKLITDIDALQLDVDTVVPLGLILNELISNALKYAFEKNHDGVLEVKLKKVNDSLFLLVKDNGTGLPAATDVTKTNSMGYKLVQSFLQKLAATITIKNDNGLSIELKIDKFKLTKE